MPTEHQEELFGEFKKKKSRFRKIADKLIEKRPRLYIHIPLENIVFTIIIAVMCIIVAFALGVERGKRFTFPAMAKKEAVIVEERINEQQKERATSEISEKGGEYKFTIQLISYQQKELAENEKDKLLNKKIDAFIIPLGKWHQVCAGRYNDMDEAKEALKEFKKQYKGCFIRRR